MTIIENYDRAVINTEYANGNTVTITTHTNTDWKTKTFNIPDTTPCGVKSSVYPDNWEERKYNPNLCKNWMEGLPAVRDLKAIQRIDKKRELNINK